MLHRLLISTALVAGMATSASAATVSYTTSLGTQQTNYSNRAVAGIQQFDSSLGTLNTATIALTGLVAGSVDYESLDASASTVTMNLIAEVAISTTALGVVVVTLPTVTETRAVTAYDGGIDFSGTSGGGIAGLNTTAANSVTLLGGSLTEFIGTGFVSLLMSGQGLSTANGPGNLATIFQTFAGGTVTVTYDYLQAPPPPPSAVPLPAGMSLILVGLGSLAAMRRRKKI